MTRPKGSAGAGAGGRVELGAAGVTARVPGEHFPSRLWTHQRRYCLGLQHALWLVMTSDTGRVPGSQSSRASRRAEEDVPCNAHDGDSRHCAKPQPPAPGPWTTDNLAMSRPLSIPPLIHPLTCSAHLLLIYEPTLALVVLPSRPGQPDEESRGAARMEGSLTRLHFLVCLRLSSTGW